MRNDIDINSMDNPALTELLRQQEIKLKEYQTKFDCLAKSAGAAVFFVTCDGELQCYSHTPKAICLETWHDGHKHLSDIVHPNDRPRVMSFFQNLVDEKGAADGGIVFRAATESNCWINARVSAVRGDDGKLKYAVGLARDITAKRQQSERLYEVKAGAAETRRALEALHEYITNKFNPSIELVRKNLEIVKTHVCTAGHDASSAVNSAYEVLSSLQANLEEYTAGKSGKKHGVARAVFLDANVMVDMVIRKLSHELEELGVVVKNLTPAHTRILAHPATLHKVLRGLLKKMVEMSGQGGVVEIFHLKDQPGALGIRGAAPESMSYNQVCELFTPYHDMLAEYDGALKIEIEGAWLVLRLSLFYRRPVAILADDDDNLLFLMRTYMDLLGVDSMEAQNGREALELARESIPDIIVTDYMMPEMDGLELLCAVRDEESLCNIPVIMITSMREAQLREKLFAHGANDLLQKPLTERELIPRIRHFLA